MSSNHQPSDQDLPIGTGGLRRPPSVVVGLIKTVYDHHPPKSRTCGGARSFRRLNAALQLVLKAAIVASLPFETDDFEQIYHSFGGSYWFADGGEGFYRIAVEHDNVSACRSFEAWVGRKPFMWNRKRLAHASTLVWRNGVHSELVRVTSLCDTHLVACAYDAPWPAGKVVRRYTITHKQLRVARRKAKA